MKTKILISILLLIVGTEAFSQESYAQDNFTQENIVRKAPEALPLQCSLPYYDCVDYDKNKIIFPGSSERMAGFYKKLDSLVLFGNQRINIMHIGGSHVQADIFSNRIRRNLSEIVPDFAAQRGLIFPFSAAKTNNPQNYTIRYSGNWTKRQNSLPPTTENLGISGYSISTGCTDATISFRLNSDSSGIWQYNRLTLQAAVADTASILPLLVVGEDTIISRLTESGYIFNLTQLSDSGTIILRRQYDVKHLCREIDTTATPCRYRVEDCGEGEIFTLFGLLPENDFNGLTYHALGVNGASLKSWLRCSNFAEELKLIKPDLVILGVGINDANIPYGTFNPEVFKAEYQQLLRVIYEVSPDCAVIVITNNDSVLRKGKSSYGINRNGELVQRAMRELAAEENGGLWDQYAIMGGAGSMAVWKERGLAREDRVHFTCTGYELLGDMFFNALIYDWLYNR